MGKVPGDTYRVYAVMQNEGDILDAVWRSICAVEGDVYSSFLSPPEGGPLSASIQRYHAIQDETLLYDSWVTIGAEDNYMNSVSASSWRMPWWCSMKGDVGNERWGVVCDSRQTSGGSRSLEAHFVDAADTAGEVNGLINLHGRSRQVTDSEGNVIEPHKEIKREGLTFVCKRPL